MNIKQIVDKIPKEADINPNEYVVADRIDDVNSRLLILVERANQTGSKEPVNDGEDISEDFTVVAGSNAFDRTIKNVPILRVDWRPNNTSRWCRLEMDKTRAINTWAYCDIKFFANEKQVFVENGRAGELRVTYSRGEVTLFTVADYNNVNPPSPDILPIEFHDLLWLYPALRQARIYKKDRVAGLEADVNELQELFDNHYGRNASSESKFRSENSNCCGGNNYR